MKDFHLGCWLLSYNLSNISAKLVISLKYNIIFAKFLEILLDNDVTSPHTNDRWQSKINSEVIWYFIKDTISPKCFLKMHLENSWNTLGLTKSIETIKLYKRSFCRCYSLCFSISMVSHSWKKLMWKDVKIS